MPGPDDDSENESPPALTYSIARAQTIAKMTTIPIFVIVITVCKLTDKKFWIRVAFIRPKGVRRCNNHDFLLDF